MSKADSFWNCFGLFPLNGKQSNNNVLTSPHVLEVELLFLLCGLKICWSNKMDQKVRLKIKFKRKSLDGWGGSLLVLVLLQPWKLQGCPSLSTEDASGGSLFELKCFTFSFTFFWRIDRSQECIGGYLFLTGGCGNCLVGLWRGSYLPSVTLKCPKLHWVDWLIQIYNCCTTTRPLIILYTKVAVSIVLSSWRL